MTFRKSAAHIHLPFMAERCIPLMGEAGAVVVGSGDVGGAHNIDTLVQQRAHPACSVGQPADGRCTLWRRPLGRRLWRGLRLRMRAGIFSGTHTHTHTHTHRIAQRHERQGADTGGNMAGRKAYARLFTRASLCATHIVRLGQRRVSQVCTAIWKLRAEILYCTTRLIISTG